MTRLRWESKAQPELVDITVDGKRHKQMVAEIAEILYEYFASSSVSRNLNSDSATVPGSPNHSFEKRRSATHG